MLRPCLVFLLALTPLLASCRTDPKACAAAPGHLCVHVQADAAALLQTPADTFDIEVRLGADCAQLDTPPPDAATFETVCYDPVATCLRSRSSGATTTLPLLARDGSFTIDVDLSAELKSSPAPADVIVALLSSGGCSQTGALHLPAAAPPANADLTLTTACSAWHLPCRQAAPGSTLAAAPLDHVACGGTSNAQLCCRDRCVAPPSPPIAGMTFIPAGTLTLGDPSSQFPQYAACTVQGGTTPISYQVQPFFIDTLEASLGEYNTTCPTCTPPKSSYGNCAAYAWQAVNCLTSQQADQFCTARIGAQAGQISQIPYELEWEWSAGRGQSRFPWGINGAEAPAGCMLANGALGPGGALCAPAGAPPVVAPGDAFFLDLTPAAVPWPQPQLWGLAGNVAEWVVDHDSSDTTTRGCPPVGQNYVSNGEMQIIKGGDWNDADIYMLSTSRRKMPADAASQATSQFLPAIGVRCVWRFPIKMQ